MRLSGDISPAVKEFLGVFFGVHNSITLEDIMNGPENGVGIVRNWLEPLKHPKPEPTVLPFRKPGEKTTTWYGLAFSEQQLCELTEDLMAFVGPSYSTLSGMRCRLDLGDPVEEAVLKLTGGTVLRFDNGPGFWKALELMRKVKENKPLLAAAEIRPVGRVLRDFYMSLRAGDRGWAENNLDYLKEKYLLDANNLMFLRVQMLAEFQCWDELLELKDLPDLIKMRRPLQVTSAIIKAIYFCKLDAFEAAGQQTEAVTFFRNAILPQYGNLYKNRTGLDDEEVLKSFMLMDATMIPEEEKTPIGTNIDEVVVVKETKKYLNDHNFDLAFNNLLKMANSPQRATMLMECAIELSALQVKVEAIRAVEDLSNFELDMVFALRRNQLLWEALTGSAFGEATVAKDTETIPVDWISWTEKVNKEPKWKAGIDVAREGGQEWSLEHFVGNAERVQKFVDLINAPRDSRSDYILYCSLPHILSYFQKDELWPRREFAEIYLMLWDILLLSTEGGDVDLAIFNDLCGALLRIGVTSEEYQSMLDGAREIWEKYKSPAKLDWVLDFMDLLINFPCISAATRLEFFINVTNITCTFQHRVEQRQWSYMALLFRDIGGSEVFSQLTVIVTVDKDATNLWGKIISNLEHKSVAIYTLTETAARRVKYFLENESRNILVNLFHDKVGTDRLRQFARSADFFIIATASAKHAATTFIEDNRPHHLPILRPAGKGSASMLRVLFEHIALIPD